jgi:hypothetical protein
VIFIATHQRDVGADLVIRHLIRRNAAAIRVDTDTLGTPKRHFGFENGTAYLQYEHAVVRADEVKAVWARRFSRPTVIGDAHPDYQKFVARELMEVMEGFLDTVSGPSMNDYEADRKAGNRLVQSTLAKAVGFCVPDCVVTQDAQKVTAFMSRHCKTIIKAISFGIISTDRDLVAHTSRIDSMSDLSGLLGCPTLIQPELPKKHEWRVTTVGDRIFSARTRLNAAADKLDWRRSDDVGGIFEKAELPDDISEKLLLLCERSRIKFGAHDLIETPAGDFYFLETNPAGQWGWLEAELGLTIGEAIASWLISAGG